jgi:hypothetical protein
MYDGDSIIRRGPVAEIESPTSTAEAYSTPEMMHRNKVAAPAAEAPRFDAFAVERQARQLRAQAIQAYAAGLWSWIGRSLDNARKRREEAYLARAQSVAELEARLRKLERSGELVRV